MNILYVHRTQGRAVEAVHIMGMVKAFEKLGHSVIIISPPGVSLKANFSELSNAGKNFSGKALKWIGKHLPEVFFEAAEIALNIPVYIKIRKVIQRKKIDFIYERYALNTFAGLKISKKYGIPLIIEVNDATFVERVRRLVFRGIAQKTENQIFKNAHAIVTISSYFREKIIERGFKPDKIFVLTNAIDEAEFSGRGLKRDTIREKYAVKDRVVIGYTGAFVYWHRVDMLLEAFRVLMGKYPNIQLFLVGKGFGFDKIKSLIIEYGLEGIVTLPGYISHKDIPEYISAMDICVIPDSNYYGSPMKLFEYMAMGKAVIAPRLKPLEDVIVNGASGYLFEKGNVDSLVQALSGLIENSSIRDKIGRTAKDLVFKEHTWAENARKVINIFKESKC